MLPLSSAVAVGLTLTIISCFDKPHCNATYVLYVFLRDQWEVCLLVAMI